MRDWRLTMLSRCCKSATNRMHIGETGLQIISVGRNKVDIYVVEGQGIYAWFIPLELKIVDSVKGAEVVKNMIR